MKTVQARGTQLAVEDVGSGFPILLVHGFPLNHTMWAAQIEGLSPSYRVIAPDLRGFGQSGVTEGIVTMADFADDLAAVLDALGVDEPVGLVGFSMGGYIAFAFWRKHASRVARLALVDTRASADMPPAAQGRLELARRVLEEGHGPIIEAMLEKLFAPRTLTEQPHLVEQVRGMFTSNQPAGIAAALPGLAARPDSMKLLKDISVPAIAIAGEDDGLTTPADMKKIAEGMPNASLVVVSGAGHMAPMERPENVTTLLGRFMRSDYDPAAEER